MNKILMVGLCLALNSCGESGGVKQERYDQAIEEYCERTVNQCEYDELVEEPWYTGMEDCRGVWTDEFYDQTSECADASVAGMECLASLSCAQLKEWNGSDPNDLCGAERRAQAECYVLPSP